MISVAQLLKEMPEGYEKSCFEKNAIQRKRGITDPGDLMMLCLFHLINGCSLMEISEIARLTKLGNVSDVAFMKRFENCNEWFKWILSATLTGGTFEYKKPDCLAEYRVVAIDASDVTEKGRSGRTYRLHYAFDLFKLESYQYFITPQTIGESLKNFKVNKSDLFIADRGYSSISGIEHCLTGGGDVVVRFRKGCFNVYDDNGEEVDLLKHLRTLENGDALDLSVYLAGNNFKQLPMRICAIRKTDEAIIAAKKKLRRRESRLQKSFSDEAKEINEYIILVTSLKDDICSKQVLEIYRLRWQVEIHFKRLKSILDFGELPKRRPESVMAWLNGKMIIALLIEKIILRNAFPPRGEYNEEYMA